MNRESYDAIAAEWEHARVRLSGAEQRIFDLLREGLAPGSKVLDLGCGTGRPVAEYLVEQGLRVTGIDESTRMLELARKRLPDQEWTLASLETFAPEGAFSAAIAWDSLFHIPRTAHESIFGYVRKALRRGGRFALTVGGSEHPAFTDTMFEHQFFYDSHPPEIAMKLLKDWGFDLVHTEFLNLPTSGRDKGRLAVVASAT